jgi:hypothetical protein
VFLAAGGASGAAPTPASTLASQVGRVTAKTEHGVHKGSIVSRQAPGDPLAFIDVFQLDYALWTVLGEPAEDYRFRWELGREVKLPDGGKTTVERVRREEPDLYARLMALAPVTLTVRARVHFYDAAAARTPFAEADVDLAPDMTAASGRPQAASAPASPEWGAWFSNVKVAEHVAAASDAGGPGLEQLCSVSEAAGRAVCARRLWERARRVEVAKASVIGVEWPAPDARQLVAEIWARQHRADQKRRDRAASDAEFWATPAKPPISLAAARDMPTTTVATTSRPVDQLAREARRARFQANDRSSFAITATGGETTCGSRGELHVDVHGTVGTTAAPSVTLDGQRLTGKAEAGNDGARHTFTFTFPFAVGSHTVDVELAGPRPIKRRARVSCFQSEMMVPCVGASDCPMVPTCPCRVVP